MSYVNEFRTLLRGLGDAKAGARNMEMGEVLVEVPQEWFERHGLGPAGVRTPYSKSWFLTEQQISDIFFESRPKTRWKEVY